MIMKKIQLPPNQYRHLASVLRIIERGLDEIERNVLHPGAGITIKNEQDLNTEKLKSISNIIIMGKRQISHLAEKYQIHSENLVTSRFLNSRKAKMWEVLADSLTRKQKGYGTFHEEYREEFDQDIMALDHLLEKL